MKIAFIALILSAISVLGQTDSRVTSKDTTVEQEIRQLNNDEVRAFLHNDFKVLDHIWSDDFVLTNPFNKFVNKQEVLAMVTSGFLAFTTYERLGFRSHSSRLI